MSNLLSPPPAKSPIPKKEIPKTYRNMRLQAFLGIFIGYAGFYLVRKNFSLAMPLLEQALELNKSQLGFAFSLNATAYGLSKFIMGGFSDRSDARKFLPLGLLLASIAIMLAGSAFGLYNLTTMAVCQFLIGWVGGMGWPPCGRVMTHWFSQNERGTMMSVWNLAHNIGGAAIGPITSFGFTWALTAHYSQLTSIQFGYFILPALIAILIALIAFLLIRDTPQSCGLPAIEAYRNDYPSNYSEEREKVLPLKEIFFTYVLKNKVLWIVACANIFVYLVRYGVLDWAPTYLQQVKGYNIKAAGWAYAYYELAAIPGTLLCGWMSDKVFRGKRSIPNICFMIFVAIAIFFYWHNGRGGALDSFTDLLTTDKQLIDNIALVAIGFFIYGPIMLIGVQALDLAPKNAAGTAAGLTGFFGYFFGTSLLANILLGYVIDHDASWNGYFQILLSGCLITIILMLLTIKAERALMKKKTD